MSLGINDQELTNLRRWKAEPVAFIREVLFAEPDPWQADLAAAFPTQNRLAAAACKGPGKTGLAAMLVWNFLLTRLDAKVPCTSITGANLQDGLWAELAKWQARSPILQKAFQWTKTKVFQKERQATWWATARTWAKDADPQSQANTLAGLHAEFIFFVVDEVGDIPDGVVAAAEGALTSGEETKLLILGNCTQNSGPLYRACTTERNLWHVTRITGDPDDPNRSTRINPEEARAQIEKYGRDSYIVRVNILGLFPTRQADKLLDIQDCEAAQRRTAPEAAYRREARILGLDVARFGDDAASLAFRQGCVAYKPAEYRGLDTQELADRLIDAIEKWDADHAFVDDGAMGAGVIDACRRRGYGNKVTGINFGGRARDSERFENRRAEMYWDAAEWVRAHGCLPSHPPLAEQLAAPIYFFDRRGRICLEPKADIKARLGRSPDDADGFVLTFAGPVRPRRLEFELPYAAKTDVAEMRRNPFDRQR